MHLKKFFKPIGSGGASAIVAFTSFLSYVVGLLRDKTIAYHFGTSTATDTYSASFLIPDMLFNMFIAGALVAAFMPVFSEYLNKDKKEAFSLANTMLSSASLVISVLAIIAFIFMDSIVPLLFPSVDAEAQRSIIIMTRLMLPSALIFAISNAIGNILMTYRHFLSFAISPVLYNLGIIVGVVFLNEQLGIYSAATGVLIGATLHLLIRLVDIFSTGFKYRPELKVKHPGFKKIIKLMIPKSISLIAWQLNLYAFTIVGMRLTEGGIAAFNFARNIQSFPVSIFGIAFTVAIFPTLNSAINNGRKDLYTSSIQTTIQRILFFTIPAAVGVLLLAEPITRLILGGGAFDEKSIEMTALILTFFALSIPLEALTTIFARSFYALQNTITPMIINLFSLAFIASITVFIAPKFGIEWFSVGFTAGFLIYNILFIALLSKHLKGFDFKKFFNSFFKICISSGIMGLAIYLAKSINLPIHEAISGITIGGAIYLLTSYLIKTPELNSVNMVIKRLLKK
ncbi:murein biosynthesis integral membrane protein MurJ [Candidatus Peregrinibacteria bacterium]|nr:murein biosynthesis integral membrane protein MurJ [Candidatus Peregrinibacteria bacterium]MBT4055489.1 murein biosynthesis integral membrane protein MurJ [Candidatus Peregrinibacteria bacterium]